MTMAGSLLMSNRLIGQHAAYHAPRVRLRVGSAALQTICMRSDMASASAREDGVSALPESLPQAGGRRSVETRNRAVSGLNATRSIGFDLAIEMSCPFSRRGREPRHHHPGLPDGHLRSRR